MASFLIVWDKHTMGKSVTYLLSTLYNNQEGKGENHEQERPPGDPE